MASTCPPEGSSPREHLAAGGSREQCLESRRSSTSLTLVVVEAETKDRCTAGPRGRGKTYQNSEFWVLGEGARPDSPGERQTSPSRKSKDAHQAQGKKDEYSGMHHIVSSLRTGCVWAGEDQAVLQRDCLRTDGVQGSGR